MLNDFLDDFLLDREIWFTLAKSKMVYERLYPVNSSQKKKIQKSRRLSVTECTYMAKMITGLLIGPKLTNLVAF